MNLNSHCTLRTRHLVSIGLIAVLAGCAAMAGASIIDIALNAVKKTFLGVATQNYGDAYKDDFDKLLTVLMKQEGAPPGTTPTDPNAPQPAPGTTPVAAPLPPPLEFEVGLWKEEIVDGRSMPVPIVDGETLYDKFGTHGEGDNVKFSFRASLDCWVYVFAIDGTGWAQPIFPSTYAGFANPVKPNQPYMFPEGNDWIPLDSYRGFEHLYFLASRTPRPDLDQALTTIAAHNREADVARGEEKQKELLAEVRDAAPVTRGWDVKPRTSTVPAVENRQGEKFPVEAQIFANKGAGDIVVTRWIRHQ